MRMSRFRFTLRQMIIAAAIVTLSLGVVATLIRWFEARKNAVLEAKIAAKNEETERFLKPLRAGQQAVEEQLRWAQARAVPASAPVRPDDDDLVPSLTETDGHVFDAFLRILAEDPEFNPAQSSGAHLVLDAKVEKLRRWKTVQQPDGTVARVAPDDEQGENLTKEELAAMSGQVDPDDGLEAEVSRQITLSEAIRNSKRQVPLDAYRPSGVDVSVVDVSLNDLGFGLPIGKFWAEHPEIKALIRPRLPGYSKDGMTAFVSFSYAPGGMHGAGGWMVFRYVSGRWVVAKIRMYHNM